jgi:phage gpG-like protein
MNIEINLSQKNSQKITDKIQKAIENGIKTGLRHSGNYMVKEVRRQMELPKTGNTYIFYKTKGRKKIQRERTQSSKYSTISTSSKILRYPAPKGLKIAAGSSYTHKASNSSGEESSAVLTGKLSKSVYTKSHGANKQIIGATAKHASLQEFGTDKIAPRNNIRRPLAQNRTLIATKIRNAITNNIKNI